MPLDAVCLSAVLDELRVLIGGRIDKIHQPERDELGLAVRSQIGNVRLLISANQNNARIHLTEHARENPQTPPMFCMLLRKHLTGARITDISQPPNERIAQFHLDATDEFGERVKRTLSIEMMGRSANIVLIDDEGRVIDCVKRAEGDTKRPMLPGLFYRLPEPREGFSPLITRELEYVSREKLTELIDTKNFTPVMLLSDGMPKDFSFMPIMQYQGIYTSQTFDSFSKLLDAFYTQRDTREHLQRRAAALKKTASNALERARRKIVLQNEEYAATLNREKWRQYGDLLMANLGNIKRGAVFAKVEDFYNGGETEIPLNPALSPQQNAAKYYKDYSKAKTAQEKLTELIEKGGVDIEYLENVCDSIDRVTGEQDIVEIREELEATGFLPRSRQKQRSKPSKPLVFRSDSGVTIYVGRNNRQNDELTLKIAAKSDVWLHAQKIPGSHVIIDCGGEIPDDVTLEQAAILAATYSQGKIKVPVDYTQARYVKKAAGGKPGLVIYDKFKTITVDSDERLAEKLRLPK